MTFFFSGYDDDPRETAEIPEIRAWFSELTGEFPYWLHFIEKEGDTMFHVLRLLCAGHVERFEGGMVGWRFDDMGQLSTASASTGNGPDPTVRPLWADENRAKPGTRWRARRRTTPRCWRSGPCARERGRASHPSVCGAPTGLQPARGLAASWAWASAR